MHKVTIIFILLVLISCQEEESCTEYNSNKGLILREPQMGECYSVLQKQLYFINDSNAYKQLHMEIDTLISQSLGCASNPDRPDINFDTLSLLAAKTVTNGCTVSYQREVSYDESSNTCNYFIDIYECGDCNKPRINMNYVLIEKIPDSTRIVLEVEYIGEP